MMQVMGSVYKASGYIHRAEPLLRHAVETRRRILGAQNQDTLKSMFDLATVLEDESRYPEAEKINRGALEVARRVFGPQDKSSRTALHHPAIDLAYEGKYADAEKAFREVLMIGERLAPTIRLYWGT
jgi:tetratricopeptide (TPR) repeat protein